MADDPRLSSLDKARRIQTGRTVAKVFLTAEDLMFDATVRHMIALERYKVGLFQRLRGNLATTFDDVLAETQKDLDLMTRRARFDTVSGRQQAIRSTTSRLMRKNAKRFKEGYAIAEAGLSFEMSKLGISEAEWARAALKASLPISIDFATPAVNTLETLVAQTPANGKLIGEWFTELSNQAQSKVGQGIRAGIAEGKGVPQIVRGLKRDVGKQLGRQLETATRTIASSTSNITREAAFRRSNVVKAVKFVATLDGRTTFICATLDGRVFQIGEGQRPPMHPNCRSGIVAVLKSWREMGIKAKEIGPFGRAQLPGARGKATSETTFATFLKRQPAAWQDKWMGPVRGKAYRAGKVEIDDFVNFSGASPKIVTTADLKIA